MGCHALLQGIFPTKGENPGFLHCRRILYSLRHLGSSCVFLQAYFILPLFAWTALTILASFPFYQILSHLKTFSMCLKTIIIYFSMPTAFFPKGMDLNFITFMLSSLTPGQFLSFNPVLSLGEACRLKPSTLARHHLPGQTSFAWGFRTRGPGKEHGTNNKPSSTGRVQERSKSDPTCPTTSQNPSCWHPSWLNKACTTRKDAESECLAKDNPN